MPIKKTLTSVAAALALVCATVISAAPAFATPIEPRTSTSTDSSEHTPVYTSLDDDRTITKIEPTFAEEKNGTDSATLRFGKHLIFAGNNGSSNANVKGIFFGFGNMINLSSESEYAVVAGNIANISSKVKNDLFVAGNVIKIMNGAELGRDVFGAGNNIEISADVPGDLSLAGSNIVIDNITIKGNLNLDADNVNFRGNVKVAGTLSYNENANINLDGVKASEVKPYVAESADSDIAAGDIFKGVIMGAVVATILKIAGIFIAMLLLVLAFPRIKGEIAVATENKNILKTFAVGAGFLLGAPIVAILLLISVVGIAAGLILLGVYILAIALSLGYSGAWLGHYLFNRLGGKNLPFLLETFLGILIIKVAGIVPILGGLVGLASLLLGLGVFISTLLPGKKNNKTSVAEAKPAKLAAGKKAKKA